MKNILIIMLSTIILYSCQNTNYLKRTSSSEVVNILDAQNNIIPYSLSKMGVSVVENVFLEYCPDSKIYDISAISINPRFIVIKDKITRTITVFNRAGEYLFNVKPEIDSTHSKMQFSHLSSTCQTVPIIYPRQKLMKIFSSDGTLIDTYPIDPLFVDMAHFSSDNYFTYYPKPRNLFNSDFSINSYKEQSVSGRFIKNTDRNLDEFDLISFRYFRPYKDKVVMWEYYDNVILSVKEDGHVNQEAFLEISKDKLDYRKMDNFFELNNRTMETNSISRVLFAQNQIFFQATFKGHIHFLLYDRRDKSITDVDYWTNPEKNGIHDDIQHLGCMLPFDVTAEGEFVSILKHSELMNTFNDDTAKIARSLYTTIKSQANNKNPLIRIFKY